MGEDVAGKPRQFLFADPQAPAGGREIKLLGLRAGRSEPASRASHRRFRVGRLHAGHAKAPRRQSQRAQGPGKLRAHRERREEARYLARRRPLGCHSFQLRAARQPHAGGRLRGAAAGDRRPAEKHRCEAHLGQHHPAARRWQGRSWTPWWNATWSQPG